MGNLISKLQGAWAAVRRSRPFVDHAARGYSRYSADGGDRLAAAVTYFGFLSFFPIVALAFSVAGFVVDAYPSAQTDLIKQINSFLPGLADKLDVASIGRAKVGSGLIGLAGLLLAGLGWVDALRDAIRTIWHHNVEAGNFVVKKVVDIAVLAGIGLTLIVSIAVTGVASAATTWFLDLLGIGTSVGARVFVRVLGIALAILADMGLFLFLFTRLPRVSTPWRRVLKGTLLGAVGFEILKVVGSLLVARTTKNPVYGAFAVIVGLLIWINLVSRFTLFVAAWTVTAPYDTDVAPSGTASEEMAKKADIPTEFADNDPDDPPTMLKDGAPAPLANAVQGKTPPQDEPTGKESTDELVGADDGGDSSGGSRGSGGGADGGVRTNDTGDGSSSGRPVRGDAAQPARRDAAQPANEHATDGGSRHPDGVAVAADRATAEEDAAPSRTSDRIGRGAGLAAGVAVAGIRALRGKNKE